MGSDDVSARHQYSSKEAVGAWMKQLERLYEGRESGKFIPAGLGALDEVIFGWWRGTLNVIGGRPAMGQTGLLLRSALHAAREQDCSTAVVPMVSRLGESGLRLQEMMTGVRRDRLRRGQMSEQDWEDVIDAAKTLSELPMHWLTTPRVTVEQLAEWCGGLKRREGLDIVFVECLQKMRAAGNYQSFQEEVAEVVCGLRELAAEHELAVVATAQVNRGPEHRRDKRPRPADLRNSGQIEHLADLVVLLYRDEMYYPDKATAGEVEATVWKNRLTEHTGTAKLPYSEWSKGDGKF